MAIQSSVNALMQQIYTIGAIGAGLRQQKKQTNETKIQTEIAAGNAQMKDGKVDPEWLQKRREQYTLDNGIFSSTGELTARGAMKAQRILSKNAKGERIGFGDKKFMEDHRVQEYLKSFNESTAGKVLANKRVVERTDSINQAKADFDEHVASLIRYYGKGSGNP